MKKIRVILFDIDGTLLHTGGAGRIAFERAFDKLHKKNGVWGNLRPDGKTDGMIIHEITERVLGRRLESSEYEVLARTYLQYFDEEMISPPSFSLMPGVRNLLESCSRRKRLLLGIATGNFEEAAWIKLKSGKIDHFFKFGGFGSDADDRVGLTKAAYERACRTLGGTIDPEECAVVGDTPFDVRAGKVLGMKTVAVSTGSTPMNDLRSENPDYLFKDFSDEMLFFRSLPFAD